MDSIKTRIFIIFDFLHFLIAFCVVGVSLYSFQFLVHTLNNNMDNKLLLLSDKLDIVSLGRLCASSPPAASHLSVTGFIKLH